MWIPGIHSNQLRDDIETYPQEMSRCDLQFVGYQLLALLQHVFYTICQNFKSCGVWNLNSTQLETTEELKSRGIDVYATGLKGNLTGEQYLNAGNDSGCTQ